MHSLVARMTIAWRELARRPSLSIAAWLALALGIALNTAMFSVVNGFLLRPLPVEAIDDVVRVREIVRGNGPEQVFSLSPATFVAWQENNTVFSDMAAATGEAVTLTGSGEAERLQAALVTANFLDVLRIAPVLGRDFVQGEDRSGANDVLLLSHDTWMSRFGGREDVIGETVAIDGRARTIVGIMPRGVHHPYEADVWMPFALDELLRAPAGNFLYVPARLAPNVDLATARTELDRMAATLNASRPDLGETNAARLTPLRDELLGTLRPVIYVLLAGSLLVLLLALLNVVNLLYARVVSDEQDNAVRLALGARAQDLFGRALLRNGVLCAAAWAAGIALCTVIVEPLLGLSAAASIDEFDAAARLDLPTTAYSLLLAAMLAFFLAILEARQANAIAPAKGLARSTGGGLPRSLSRKLSGLVMLQFSLSFALAGCALVVATNYEAVVGGKRGYETEGTTVFDIAFPDARYPATPERVAFVDTLLERLRNLPGVEAAGAATVTPDYPGSWGGAFLVPGRVPPDPPGYELTNHRLVSSGYFESLGIPLLAGRDIDARDASSIVVSREFAETYWGDVQAAIGRTVNRRTRGEIVELRIAGVVGDVSEAEQSRDWTVTHAWYLPLPMGTDYDFGGISIVVKGGDEAVVPLLRSTVQSLDSDLAPFAMMSMADRLAETYSRERFSRFLFGLFAGTACVISLVGLYSALSFVTALRRREFGVRLALGASPSNVASGVVLRALLACLAGIAIGIPILLLLAGLAGETVSTRPAGQAAALTALACAFVVAASVAAAVPAIRAARVDPMQALRQE